jgi:hypothetical protein
MKRKAISDTERLDFLARQRDWEFFKHDAFQLTMRPWSFARHSIRQAIDAAIRAAAKRRSK